MRFAVNWHVLGWVIISILATQQAQCQEVSAEGAAGNVNLVSELTTRAAAKEIELQQLNAQFRLRSTRQPRWRPWRQLAYS